MLCGQDEESIFLVSPAVMSLMHKVIGTCMSLPRERPRKRLIIKSRLSACCFLFDYYYSMVVSLMEAPMYGMSSTPASHGPTTHAFNPYTDNGGSIMAIAGKDFCVIAGDTRQSEGYNIQTRYKPKVFRL
jgi:hypothetical protein